MQFTPKTEEQIIEENLLESGIYDFEIIVGEDKESKNKNEMIELKLKVFNDKGGYNLIHDYLLEKLAFKLRHAAEACNLIDNYNCGKLVASDFIGKSGKVKIGIDSGNPQYPPKNTIKDYITQEESGFQKAIKEKPIDTQTPISELDDDIPF